MSGSGTVHDQLIGARSELLDVDRTETDPECRRARLAHLARQVAFTDILAADEEDRRLARRLVHACVSRLVPLQQSAPRPARDLPASPDEEWLLAPLGWTDADLEPVLARWNELEPVRPHLVLLIPVPSLAAGEVVCPLWPDTSVRYIGVDATLALGAPLVLVGSGSPAGAVEEAVRRVAS